MFVTGFERLDFSCQSEIVSFSKSHCGKYLGVLFRNALQIRSLTQISLSIISDFFRDDASLLSGGFNHWIQWVSSEILVIGTQSGHLIFLQLDQTGKIESTTSLVLGKIITAHSSAFGALVLATSGPYLHFISPGSGEVLSTLSFPAAIPVIIRQIDISDPIAVLTFSDGTAAQITFKQSEIIQQKPISVNFLPVSEVSVATIVSNPKNSIALLTFVGSLIRISTSTSEISYICDDTSLFQTTRDSSHFISLSANGTVSIWSNRTQKVSKTKLKFPFLSEKSNPNFITSEIDLNGLRFFCSTSSDSFIITFAITDNLSPSLLFHTPTYVIIPTTKVTITVPNEMNETGFPLHSVAYCTEMKKIAIAGRRCFAVYSESNIKWHLVKDDKNLCRALFSHKSFFVSVVFDYENPQYKLLLLSSNDLSVVNAGLLEGVFIGYDNRTTHFAIATSQSVSVFKINKGNQIILTKRYVDLPVFTQFVLYHDGESIAILTLEKELIEIPSNNLLIEGVSSVFVCKEDDLLFIVAHGQQFAMYDGTLIRIGMPGIIADGLVLYSAPEEYECGDFMLNEGEFLPKILFRFIEKPEMMEKIMRPFLCTRNYSIAISHALDLALDAGKLDLFSKFFDRLGDAKLSLIIITLFNVNPKYINEIKKLLPPKDELVQLFPDISDQIKGIYSS